jgi:peroxiredoxin
MFTRLVGCLLLGMTNVLAAAEVPASNPELEAIQEAFEMKSAAIRKQAEDLQKPVNEEFSKQLQKHLRENPLDIKSVALFQRIEQLKTGFEPETIKLLQESKHESIRSYLMNGGVKIWAEPIYRKYLDSETDPVTRCFLMKNISSVHMERMMNLESRTALKDEDFERMIAEATEFYAKVTEVRNATDAVNDKLRSYHEVLEHHLPRMARLAKLRIGKPAPDIVGQSLAGQPLALSDARGKVTVVVFWASWCGPCMRMVPHERELFKRMQGKPFALYGVNRDHELEKAQHAVEKNDMVWQHWQDEGKKGSIAELYSVSSIPQIFVLDPQGIIRYINVRGSELDAAVDHLMSEVTSKP